MSSFLDSLSDFIDLKVEIKSSSVKDDFSLEKVIDLSEHDYNVELTLQGKNPLSTKTKLGIYQHEVEFALASISKYPTRAGSQWSEKSSQTYFDPIVEIGSRMFSNTFKGRPEAIYRNALEEAKEQGKGLRIRLILHDFELVDLPWEFLYDPYQQDFVSINLYSPIVRTWHTELKTDPPQPPSNVLRVLIVTGPSPTDSVNSYWEDIKVLQFLEKLHPQLKLFILTEPKPNELIKYVINNDFDVFHFAGSGMPCLYGSSRSYEEQGLVLAPITTQDSCTKLDSKQFNINIELTRKLKSELSNKKGLRLILLNACYTEKIASSLATREFAYIPTIGFRNELADESFSAFANAFYQTILKGSSLEMAVTKGRQSIDAQYPGRREWGLPVFYMPESQSVFLLKQEEITPEPDIPASNIRGSRQALKVDPANQREYERITLLLAMQKKTLELLTKKSALYMDKPPLLIEEQIKEVTERIRKLREELDALQGTHR